MFHIFRLSVYTIFMMVSNKKQTWVAMQSFQLVILQMCLLENQAKSCKNFLVVASIYQISHAFCYKFNFCFRSPPKLEISFKFKVYCIRIQFRMGLIHPALCDGKFGKCFQKRKNSGIFIGKIHFATGKKLSHRFFKIY